MLIKQAVKFLLLSDAGLEAVIDNRLFPGHFPQKGPFPLIAFGRTGRESTYRLDRARPTEKLVKVWFEFMCAAQGPNADSISEDLDDLLFDLIDGWSGVVSDDHSPESTLTIQGIFSEKLTDLYSDQVQQNVTRSVYRVEYVRSQRSLI